MCADLPAHELSLLGHACERGVETAEVVVELTRVTARELVLVMCLTTHLTPTAAAAQVGSDHVMNITTAGVRSQKQHTTVGVRSH